MFRILMAICLFQSSTLQAQGVGQFRLSEAQKERQELLPTSFRVENKVDLVDQCNWEQLPLDTKDPVKSCEAYSSMNLAYSECLSESKTIRAGGQMTLLLRREQMRFIFQAELFYLGRLSHEDRSYKDSWAKFETKWRQRFLENPDVLAIDQSPILPRRDRCLLNQIAGRSCEGTTSLNYFRLRQSVAEETRTRLAKQKNFPRGVFYELLEAELVTLSFKAVPNPEPSAAADAQRKDAENIFRGYFPELAIDLAFQAELEKIARSFADSHLLFQNLATMTRAGRSFLFIERLDIVDRLIAENTADLLLQRESRHLSMLFENVTRRLVYELDDLLDRGQSDPNWLWSQLNLIQTAIPRAARHKRPQDAKILEDMLCTGLWAHKDSVHRADEMLRFGGAAVLLTGYGSLLDLGAVMGAILTGTSVGLIGAMTGASLIVANEDATDARVDLLLRQGSASDFSEAYNQLEILVPFAFLNIALLYPRIFLLEVTEAKRGADLANNLAEVARLQKIRSALTGPIIASTGGFAWLVGKDAWDGGWGVWKDYHPAEKSSNETPKKGP